MGAGKDKELLTLVDSFILKNDLSMAEYEHLLIRNSLGKTAIGWITFPNGNRKYITK